MEEMKVFNLIQLMALTIGVYVGILLLFLRKKSRAVLLIALFMLLQFAPQVLNFSYYLLYQQELHAPDMVFACMFLLWVYARRMTAVYEKKDWAWLPLVLLLSYWFEFADFSTRLAHLFAPFAFTVVLGVLIIALIDQHQRRLAEYFSQTEDKSLSWLKVLVWMSIAFQLLWVIEEVFEESAFLAMSLPWVSLFATLLFVSWVGVSVFLQDVIYKDGFLLDRQSGELSSKGLDEQEEQVYNRLLQLMEEQYLYANHNLSLHELADRLEVKVKSLSRIINVKTGDNFYAFVNRYRVEEVKEKMQSQEASQKTLFALAQESGFKSRSTFYLAFKKIEGITPGEYERRLA